MTSHNVLQPINCNVRDLDLPPSKRAKLEISTKTKIEPLQRWSLSNRQNQFQALAEMGIGMLDADELSDCKSEDDTCKPSSSKLEYDLNDTNPEFINLPGECISTSSTSNDSEEYTTNKTSTKEMTEHRKELLRDSKNWDDFCIYRRTSMVNRDAKDWFNCLSDEIILMVFKWLPKVALVNCALVCKRWHRLTTDETLWTRLDCSLNVLGPGAMGHILSRQVLVLRMSQSEILDPPISPGVKAYADDFEAKLMYLDLSMATVSPEGLATILSKCNRLKKLSLESCVVSTDVCISISNNQHLEVLNMSNAEGLNEQGVWHLLQSFNHLKELNVAWTCLNEKCLDLFCNNLPSSLTRLNISGCRKTLHSAHVKKLVISCPRLKELDLSDCTALTNDVIKDIIQLKDINFLALSRCYGIQCIGLRRLVYCKSLTYLDVHGGHIEQREINELQKVLGNGVQLNKFMFSSVARPTVGMKRSSIWGLRVRD